MHENSLKLSNAAVVLVEHVIDMEMLENVHDFKSTQIFPAEKYTKHCKKKANCNKNSIKMKSHKNL